MAQLLSLNGYCERTAYNRDSAWALIKIFEPLCVLFDVKMPGMRGAELAKQLRNAYGNEVVLIAISGVAQDDEQVAEAFGRVDYYLEKPLNLAKP